MGIKDVYTWMKKIRDKMYENNSTTVVLTQTEFFILYQMVCYMMQIQHIVEEQN